MISFNNTEKAFAYKTDDELKSAHFLFKLMGNATMVKIGLNLIPGAIKINFPFTKKLVRSTIFRQFVGGETLSDTIPVVNKLAQHKVQVILDYGVEGGHDGEKGFDESTAQFIRVIDFAATQPNIPFMSIKVTGIARFSLLEIIDTGMHAAQGTLADRYKDVLKALPLKEQQEWNRVEERLRKICITSLLSIATRNTRRSKRIRIVTTGCGRLRPKNTVSLTRFSSGKRSDGSKV